MENKLVPKLRFPEFADIEGWNDEELGQIGEFIGGGTPDTLIPEYWNGSIQWYTPTEIKNGSISKSLRTITNEGLINSSAKILPIGTILITTRATIGDVAITNEICTTNQGFQSLVVKQNQVNRFWFYWILKHKYELIRRASGSTFPEIGKSEIAKIKALHPDKQEQQKIADCLSSLDDLISAESEKLDALKEHKKGLMQQLFTVEGEKVPKLRFSEFKDGGEWLEARLGDVANYENGKAHEQDISSTGKYTVVNSKFISTDGEVKKYTDTANCLAKTDDILMVLSDVPNGRAIAKCFLVEKEDLYTVNQRVCKITPITSDGRFLYYIINRNQYFLAFDDGVKQTNLKTDDVKDFLFFQPPSSNEQCKIGEILLSLEKTIFCQLQKIEDLKLHKKGLMQRLFPDVN